MANTAKAITGGFWEGGVRVISGTLGADGALELGERFEKARTILIQLTGTFNSSVQTMQISLDGTNYVALPTMLAFSAAGIKSVALADRGFRKLQFSGASAGGSSDIAFTVIAIYQEEFD